MLVIANLFTIPSQTIMKDWSSRYIVSFLGQRVCFSEEQILTSEGVFLIRIYGMEHGGKTVAVRL
ncbi:Uncharacterized protein TCM_042667 [Theobroma cacao]|uniref:Uncharacterized protein n=1 Tax=Theobroma cacao TaxID=3641 RepID=A0A061FKY7_THECC|nr:Uncharacterized protein TCM_042667 [Theobroma cacao]